MGTRLRLLGPPPAPQLGACFGERIVDVAIGVGVGRCQGADAGTRFIRRFQVSAFLRALTHRVIDSSGGFYRQWPLWWKMW